MTPTNHNSISTAIKAAKFLKTTPVIIKTWDRNEIVAVSYMTFRNISNSGNLVDDFPIILEENETIELLEIPDE